MSRKVELGDVYQSKNSSVRLCVVDVYETCVNTFNSEVGLFVPFAMPIKTLLEDFTYLGESKVNLEELFDVREN